MANFNIDYLVVAGGGGGGGDSNSGYLSGAGGGAGGMRTSFGTGNVNGGLTPVESTLNLANATSYTVEVGQGGAGMVDSLTQTAYGYQGVKGGDSTFHTIISTGGGGGGTMGAYPYTDTSSKGGVGGSGGGSGFRNGPSTGTGSAATPYSATPVQGFVGGSNGPPYSVGYSSGGGGGAGGAGGDGGPNPNNGPGGLGLQNAISGTNTFYAGGGGGSTYRNSYAAPGPGGSGIGGDGGGSYSNIAGVGGNGVANTGSGGGGGNSGYGSVAQAGGSGGSGIVIIKFANADVASYTITGNSPAVNTDTITTVMSFTTVGTSSIIFTTPPPPPTFDGTKVTTPVTGFESNVNIGLKIPVGTNSNLPTGVEGMIRNDTDEVSGGTNSTTAITFYNGTDWKYFTSTVSQDSPPIENFNTVLYTGTGAINAITGVGFQPDLVWIKERDGTPSHHIFDVLRGGNKKISSNNTSAEGSALQFTLDNDGFSINNSAYVDLNGLNDEYVAWCFKAGGLINKAADFNGSSSYVNLPSNPISGTGDYSVSVWAKCDNLSAGSSGQQYITQFGSIASSGGGSVIAKWANNSGSANKIYIHVGGGYVLTSHVVVLGAWTHYAVTQTGTSILFYVNGSLHDTLTAPSSPNRTSGNSSIGYYNNGINSYFGGNIQQVRVFNSVLTSSEVTELYNETKVDNSVLNFPNGAGCVAAYPLGENANGLDGLYNGTASSVTFGSPGYLTRNNEGTIESTVSVNNNLGFSIVKTTGTSGTINFGHGLDTAPEMIINKGLTSNGWSWLVYHKDIGTGKYLKLNSIDTETPNANSFSSVTSTTITNNSSNGSSDYINYCFTSKPGLSKVGSYIGNGNTNGPTVTLGFEPAWVMIKGANEQSGWLIIDNKRSPSNPANKRLDADDNAAEVTETIMDLNSDNFQLKTASAGKNASGKTFIYLAFAT